MSARASLCLVTIGAILTFAVRAEPSFLDLHVTGVILITVGLIRPLVAGWSSMAPRSGGRRRVVDDLGAPEPPPAGPATAHRTSAGRSAPPARHPARSATSA